MVACSFFVPFPYSLSIIMSATVIFSECRLLDYDNLLLKKPLTFPLHSENNPNSFSGILMFAGLWCRLLSILPLHAASLTYELSFIFLVNPSFSYLRTLTHSSYSHLIRWSFLTCQAFSYTFSLSLNVTSQKDLARLSPCKAGPSLLP